MLVRYNKNVSALLSVVTRKVPPLFLLVLGCVLIQASSAQQAQKKATSNAPIFRSNARLVVLDVIVLDGSGHPVSQLKADDFKLSENGKPQRLVAFDEHQIFRPTQPPKPFHLPPHQYTNVPEEEASGPLTVILFDTLNTALTDQVAARLQMLKFLKALPSGQRTALFSLSSKLRLIQTLTGDTETLIAAASKLLSTPSPLLVTEAERQHQEDDAVYRERMIAPAVNSQGSSAISNQQATLANPLVIETQKLREALADQENHTTEQRVGLTLKSLAELAQMLRGYPGRKNLLWLSEAFPFSVGPNPFIRSEDPDSTRFDAAVRETSNLLSAAQVAVYPIDVGGIRNQGADLSSTAEGTSGVDASTGVSRLNSTLLRQLTESTDEHAIMDQIAEDTGGKAFYGTNDLQNAMQRSAEQGSHYYTLSYSPQDQNWNGKFRRIEVKLAGGYHLQYRRGYFALEIPEHSTNDSTNVLVAAVRPDMPNSTSLYLKAQVLPPDREHSEVRISCLIDPQQITFNDNENGGKHAVIDLLMVAWDKDGKDVGHSAQTVETNFNPAQYRKVLTSGLQVDQILPVSGGAHRLRLGAVDRASQSVGTIDVILDEK